MLVQTSDLLQHFPLTTYFLPLLDRLTLASSRLGSESRRGRPRALAWLGFALLTVLHIVLVFQVG